MITYPCRESFLDNKYTKWYYSIISNSQSVVRYKYRGQYYESHHILPRSLFPEYKSDPSNKVLLTPKEHFICHLLLTKMTSGLSKYKMIYAFKMFINVKNIGDRTCYKVTSKWFEYAKLESRKCSKHYWTDERRSLRSQMVKSYSATVDKTSPAYLERIEKIRQYQTTKQWSDKAIANRMENCKKSAEARTGKPWSENRRRSYVKRTQSAEERQQRSLKMKGRKTSTGMLGKHHSQETIDKIKSSNKGRANEQNFKGYWYLSPAGEEVLFCPIKEHAKLYGLHDDGLRKLRLGLLKKNKHKGWSYLRIASDDELNNIRQQGKKR